MALKDLGYDNVQIIFSDYKNSPQLLDEKGKPKSGTAYVDGKGVMTLIINAEDPKNSTRSGLIGTLSEEGSHVIGKVEGRQIATGTDEKGLKVREEQQMSISRINTGVMIQLSVSSQMVRIIPVLILGRMWGMLLGVYM